VTVKISTRIRIK